MYTTTSRFFATALISGALAFAPNASAATDKSESAPEVAATGVERMPMHRQMQDMAGKMAKMQEAKDPKVRRQLMKEHMASMRGMMQMMHGMMAGQGRDGARGCENRSGGEARGMRHRHEAPANRMMHMEQRMNMMQMMLDQMLQSQAEQLDDE